MKKPNTTAWTRVRTKVGRMFASPKKYRSEQVCHELLATRSSITADLTPKILQGDSMSPKKSLRLPAHVLRSIVQATPDAILIVSEDQEILFFNRGAERTFGYTE